MVLIMTQKEWIEEQVSDIMSNDGPDGHTDGSNIIADFIEALLEGREHEWVEDYKVKTENKHLWKI